MKQRSLLVCGLVLAVAGLVGSTRAHATEPVTHTRPVVCHYGWHCHQWRVVLPPGKAYVQVHERRHALTPIGPWTAWRSVRVS